MERNAITSVQKTMITMFLKEHPELQSSRFSNEFTFKKAQQLWQQLSVTLNSVPNGAQKEWRQWRKTWQDIKKNTKAKAVAAKNHACATGGGEPLKQLSQIDSEIMELINPTQVDGLPIAEVPVPFTLNKENDGASPSTGTIYKPSAINANIYDIPSTSNTGIECDMLLDAQEIIMDNSNAVIADHDYGTSMSTSKRTNKTNRLNKSLEVSNNLLSSIDTRNNLLDAYYKEKIQYIKDKRIFLQEKGEREKKALTVLIDIKNILNKQF